MKRIGIVGSGTGGTLAANLLASKLKNQLNSGQVSLQLFGENGDHIFQPGSLDVAFKGTSPDNLVKDEHSLLKRGVQFKTEPVVKINLGERKLFAGSNLTEYSFDYLVLATGSVAAPETVAGLAEGSLSFHKGPFEARKIWNAIKDFKGGKIVIAIAGTPHKCPPSPNEAAFLADEFLRKKGVREKSVIKFLTPYPRAYPAAEIAKTVQSLFDSKGIEVVSFFNMDYVDSVARTVNSLEGEKFEYDLLLAVPPHKGAQVIIDSGIGADEDGWIPTDKEKLTVSKYDNVFAIGDATSIPVSKSGVVAHLQAVDVASNIARDLIGASSGEEILYNGRINCPMEVGGRKATFVSANYTTPPKQNSPTLLKYVMKRGFGTMYWSALKGTWEWMFKIYFDKTNPTQKISNEKGERVEQKQPRKTVSPAVSAAEK